MMIPLRQAPRILAFDTSTTRGSVALLEGSEVRGEVKLYSPRTHSALLLHSINFLLGHLDWTLKDLNLVAVGIGPGSFTGIRIGVATALGISQSLSIPFAGVSGLDALAFQASTVNGRIGAILDAHRAQVYYAEYIGKNGKIRQSGTAMLVCISDLERRLEDRHLYIVGDVWPCRSGEFKASSPRWPRSIPVDLFLATGIGRLAFSRKNTWRSGDDLASEPIYIRPPDALKNRDRKR